MANPSVRVLVVDDEPLGRDRVTELLRREPNVEIVGEAGDGEAAVEAIRTLRPNVVFLDVQMPRMNGLDVVRTIGAEHMPATVFVTAYDKHALTAFDLAAVDYLVKPFDDERFEQAFRRARRAATASDATVLREQLLSLLQGAETTPVVSSEQRPGFLERIAVESRGKVRFVPVNDVDYIVASGPYAELYTGERRYLIRESMQHLEDRLDPAKFMRVHRSAIVRLERVDVLHKGPGGDYEVQLKGGARLRVSRSKREELERRLAR
ncbi:MAG TPA: LytTR family DNA-binding domain-containing protein [Gemmatimonadaceae bacterium]|nr:LytTR family DNA-binding domain-containing protein [Gemmatimonadaceae bacterium]